MLTRQDIKLLVESFKTRSEADYDLQRLEEKMATKNDLRKLEVDLRKLDDKFSIKFNKVLVKLDSVIKELTDSRLEQASHIQEHRDIRDEINTIKKRILSSY